MPLQKSVCGAAIGCIYEAMRSYEAEILVSRCFFSRRVVVFVLAPSIVYVL